MKINSTFEQGIYVVVILALEKDHNPLKSSQISELLQVSDSYLKKILSKLSKKGIVSSSASKRGGYQLTRSADQITLRDIYEALELHVNTFASSGYAIQLFPGQEHVIESEKKLEQAVLTGLNHFYEELDSFKISEILEDGAYQNGAIEWLERLEK